MGARTGGYSFFLHDGSAHFAYNYLTEITTVSALLGPSRLQEDSFEIAARFTKTEEFAGTLDLVVDDSVLASGHIRMLPFRQTLFGLDIGSDRGSTVTDAYSSPFSFTGSDLVVRYAMLDDRSDLRKAAEMEARSSLMDQ